MDLFFNNLLFVEKCEKKNVNIKKWTKIIAKIFHKKDFYFEKNPPFYKKNLVFRAKHAILNNKLCC